MSIVLCKEIEEEALHPPYLGISAQPLLVVGNQLVRGPKLPTGAGLGELGVGMCVGRSPEGGVALICCRQLSALSSQPDHSPETYFVI